MKQLFSRRITGRAIFRDSPFCLCLIFGLDVFLLAARWISWLVMIWRISLCLLMTVTVVGLAHAQQSALRLYGIVDLGLQWQNIGLRSPSADMLSSQRIGLASGAQSGSRWGLRGEDDLSGGLRAILVLENGFDATNGTASQGGRLFGRQSTLGLQSDRLGQLDVGRQTNLATKYFLAIDPFAQGFGQANMGASFGSTNTVRYSNMVLYQTPSMDGLKLGAGYSFDIQASQLYADNPRTLGNQNETTDFPSMNNPRALTLGATYVSGPWMVSASYDQVMGNVSIPGGAPPSIPRAWVLGGLYDFKVVKLSLAYGQGSGGAFFGQVPGTSGVGGTGKFTVTGGADVLFEQNFRSRSYLVGATAPIGGRGMMFGSWQMMQPAGTFSAAVTASQQIYSLGYSYSFSAQTDLYTYVSYAQNYAMVRDTFSTMAGLGLRYRF